MMCTIPDPSLKNGSSTRTVAACLVALLFAMVMPGCSDSPPFTLMDTPTLYSDAAIDPFARLDKSAHSTLISVFYATNRKPQHSDSRALPYGNAIAKELYLGNATVRFGGKNFTWLELYAASVTPTRDHPIDLSLANIDKMAHLPETFSKSTKQPLSAEQQTFADAINAELAKAEEKEIVVYVHGTKVDFFNAVAMTAEIDHFTGRDFVGVAFAWPSHQNILYYLLGIDVTRAKASSRALQALLEFLATHTNAEYINLLCYSAGARIATKTLQELRSSYPDLEQKDLRRSFRLGAVIFAAADVPLETFHERLPAICDLARQVVVTVSDHDPALAAAEDFMGGGLRVGEESAETKELTLIQALGIDNFEVVDLSLDQKGRGFDIVGHRYWYRHPWASSDIILVLRTDLPPHRRGLSPAEMEGVYFMSQNYPKQVRAAAARALGDSWLKRASNVR